MSYCRTVVRVVLTCVRVEVDGVLDGGHGYLHGANGLRDPLDTPLLDNLDGDAVVVARALELLGDLVKGVQIGLLQLRRTDG